MFLKDLPKPFFALAPMDDVTDVVFRQIVADCAKPDLFFTEFVNVDGLQSVGRPRLLKKICLAAGEWPVIAQVWGKKPDNFYKTTQELIEMGFAGVDINMGCPIKAVVNNGCGSGLIKEPALAVEIIKAVQAGAAGRVPISVKTRLGFNSVDFSWHETLLRQNLDMLTVHGRTRQEMSKVPADWQKIGAVRKLRDQISPQTLIVGNGDVLTRQQGLDLAKMYGLDGVMIGRGIFHDPFAFAAETPWPQFTKEQKVALYAKHVQLFAETWTDLDRPVEMLNKFCKIYINGFDDAKELREELMACKSATELLAVLAG